MTRANTSSQIKLLPLFYFLVAFDVFTVALIMTLDHWMASTYLQSASLVKAWEGREASFSELAQLAAAANAPGNDVFASRNVKLESQKLRSAVNEFNTRITKLRGELVSTTDEKQCASLYKTFDAIAHSMALMNDEANSLFVAFEHGDYSTAGARMAKMDREFEQLNSSLRSLVSDARLIKDGVRLERAKRIASIEKLEYVIALLILVMIGGAAVYGRKVAKQMAAAEREKERYDREMALAQEELREGRDQLAVANESLQAEIAERKRADAELRRSEARLNEAQQIARVGSWEWDLTNSTVTWSDELYRIFGLEPGTSPPTFVEFLECIHPEDREALQAAFEGAIVNQRSIDFHTRVVRPDGTVRVICGRREVILENDVPVRMMGTAHDVTEAKGVEEELRAARSAADAASLAKSEFLANMSHEIRTPMNGILGMLELALRDEIAPRQREFLGLARSSAETLLRLLNDILDFSKIEAGKLELESTPFSLRETFGNTLQTQATQIQAKGLELTCAIAPDVPDALVGDPGRLSQIIMNLVGNACKFTLQGEIAVRVDVASRSDNDIVLHCAVRDTGVGIPQEKQDQIFAAFVQADSSTTRQFGGSGLGLAICSQLTQALGGRIWVQSEVGKGTTFHFTVRLLQHEGELASPVPPRSDLVGMSVLVVDDNSTNRCILDELLRAWGMNPTLVNGGHAAIAAIEEANRTDRSFPLLLLDAEMPDLDGFAVADWILHDSGSAGTAIMMLSSADRHGDIERSKAMGISVYLRKPIKESELLRSMLAVLSSAPTARSEARLQRPIPAPSIRRLHILLAEDTPVNQRLVFELLAERGHTVVIANDGEEALEKLAAEKFDLILMDVQMPRKDGFQTTAAIRAEELHSDAHIPIIAMTAHALKGDAERCLAAGMDGYLSKPIQVDQFIALVEGQLLDAKPPVATRGRMEPPRIDGLVFDSREALRRALGRPALLRELAELFLVDSSELFAQIRTASASQDAQLLERVAHRLHGSASNLSAPRVAQAAHQLEAIGREGRLAESTTVCSVLEFELEQFKQAFEAFKREEATCTS